MTWEAAMRWARARVADTGVRYRVSAYVECGTGRWAYKVGRAA